MFKELTNLPKPILALITFLGLIVLISLFGLWQINRLSLELKPAKSSVQITKARTKSEQVIYVDIAGAIEKPGVYALPIDSRLITALQKAQGLTTLADRYLVAKNFNLAKKLTDEEKIYIPFLEEREMFVSDSISQTNISINNASQTQLELLPGIGPVTAKKIIDKRPYSDISELLIKKAIGQKTYENILEMIVL